ncbi:MAG: rRNA maturation RNase YbeY [Lachnospiraceae bacterium]|nr:rRNA maturation RNase YbeY [Lachnospiraceae bacterium]
MNIEIIKETDYSLDLDFDKIVNDIVTEAINEYYGHDNIELAVTLTDNEHIKEINKEHRDIDSATDVLSFPLLDFSNAGDFETIIDVDDAINPDTDDITLGDIIISLEKVKSQALEYGHSEAREFAFLVAHSMLHLMGYDHIDEDERIDMEKRQELILQNKGYLRG